MENLFKAINKVMQDVEWVAKNMTVWSGNNSYKWVADKDVKLALRESMIKNWLSILPIWWKPKIQIDRWEEVDSYSKTWAMKTKQSIFTEIETEYMLCHSSWESIKVWWYWQWVDTQDKWAWKATTYALKNTLLNMFMIPTWIDTDNTHSDEYDVPKNTQEKWYNDVDKNLEAWRNSVIQKTITPQEIIDKIVSKWFKLSWPNKEKILNLF